MSNTALLTALHQLEALLPALDQALTHHHHESAHALFAQYQTLIGIGLDELKRHPELLTASLRTQLETQRQIHLRIQRTLQQSLRQIQTDLKHLKQQNALIQRYTR